MTVEQKFLQRVGEILNPEQILLQEPMSRHTSFKIGGAADVLLLPADLPQLQMVLSLVQEYGCDWLILGKGSNVLVSDKGIRGVVIQLDGNMADKRCDGDRLIFGAGVSLKEAAEFAAVNGLTGLEFAVGIPGSVGGAVFMNAGAYDGDVSKVVSSVTTLDMQGNVCLHGREMLDFSYRHSSFQDNGLIICEVEMQLTPGVREDIAAKMKDFTQRRESKQPLELPSAGSTFKRPEGYFAGTLIDQTGLKGLRVGGAQVSAKHAGFVVNAGGASAADVQELIARVQQKVYAAHGIKLYPEVRFIGEK